MFSTGSSNSRLINRNNSTVGMSNQLGVQVKGTRVAIAGSIGKGSSSKRSSSKRSSSKSSSSKRSSSKRSNSKNRRAGCISSSKSSNVISTGSSNSRLINRNNSTI